jgi:hypothetical protein
MAENADEQVLGFLSDREQAARNEVDRLRRELEGLKNALGEGEDYLASVNAAIAHHKAKAT